MNSSTLTTEEIGNFQEIHNIFIPKRKKAFQTFYVTDKKNKKKTKPILDKALFLLKELNITNIDKKCNHMEFHKRNSGFEKKDLKNWFIWHQDDYSAVSWPCYTIIFYIRKDPTLKGGNLEYKDVGINKVQPITSGTILTFCGNIEHRPQSTTGFGCRDIIVVFIKRTKK